MPNMPNNFNFNIMVYLLYSRSLRAKTFEFFVILDFIIMHITLVHISQKAAFWCNMYH